MMNALLQQLQWALQALAQPADVQLALFPDGAHKADELALDFDHWSLCVIENFQADLTEQQLTVLNQLDRFLEAMSGQENAVHWTEEALHTDPLWAEARSLAKRALSAFGWPEGVPPTNRSVYVRS